MRNILIGVVASGAVVWLILQVVIAGLNVRIALLELKIAEADLATFESELPPKLEIIMRRYSEYYADADDKAAAVALAARIFGRHFMDFVAPNSRK